MRRNSILTMMKKELTRFFGDRRMAVTTILLPGLMIFVMYNFMGSAIRSQYSVDEKYIASARVENEPQWLHDTEEDSGIRFTQTEESERASFLQQVENQTLDLYVIFPEEFDAQAAAYDSTKGGEAPNVEIYYNSASTESQTAYQTLAGILDAYEASMINKFDINRGNQLYDLASEQDMAGSIFSSMLPMLLLIFLYSGCMAVAPESIAGEKERGTIATLLITPVKRRDIALGKILALSIIALLSGISSAAGTILSLPKLMGEAAGTISGNYYTVSDYALLGVVILSTVLVLVTAISLISAFAKTTKEAQTYVLPLMIVIMLVGITAMFGSGAQEEFFYYLIPVYNSVQCMVGIFSFEVATSQIAITVLVNLAVVGIGVYGLTRMFNSERIVFSK